MIPHSRMMRNGDFGVENNAFCNISLLTLPYIQDIDVFNADVIYNYTLKYMILR